MQQSTTQSLQQKKDFAINKPHTERCQHDLKGLKPRYFPYNFMKYKEHLRIRKPGNRWSGKTLDISNFYQVKGSRFFFHYHKIWFGQIFVSATYVSRISGLQLIRKPVSLKTENSYYALSKSRSSGGKCDTSKDKISSNWGDTLVNSLEDWFISLSGFIS